MTGNVTLRKVERGLIALGAQFPARHRDHRYVACVRYTEGKHE